MSDIGRINPYIPSWPIKPQEKIHESGTASDQQRKPPSKRNPQQQRQDDEDDPHQIDEYA